MRNDDLILARVIAVLALVTGVVGGIVLCGYAFFHGGVDLGYQISRTRATTILDIGLIGGGGLAVLGSIALLVLPRARHEASGTARHEASPRSGDTWPSATRHEPSAMRREAPLRPSRPALHL